MNTPESKIPTALPSDEIDLFALFEVIWNGKWIIAACCAAAAVAGLIYHFQFNRTVTASLNIQQLSPIEMSDFNALNQLEVVGGLTSEDLLRQNYEFISSFENVKFLIERFSLIEKQLEGELLRQEIVEVADERINASLRIPRSTDTFKPSIQIELKDDNRMQLLVMVETLINRARDQQKAALLTEFNTAIQNLEERRDFEIRRTKIEIEGITQKYFSEKADSIEVLENRISTLRSIYASQKIDEIARLQEQAAIARSLGIELPIEMDMSKIPENALVSQVSTQSQPLYFRGFKALEREVELIRSREADEAFIPGLRDLESELLKLTSRENDEAYIPGLRALQEKLFLLENDPTIPRARTEVIRLIAENPNLRFTSFDLERLVFSKFSGAKILILALFFGGVIGGMWVFVSTIIRYWKGKNANI